jgi:hypothetical protein
VTGRKIGEAHDGTAVFIAPERGWIGERRHFTPSTYEINAGPMGPAQATGLPHNEANF